MLCPVMKLILSRSNRGEEPGDIIAKLKHTDELVMFLSGTSFKCGRTVSASGLNMFFGTNRFAVQAELKLRG